MVGTESCRDHPGGAAGLQAPTGLFLPSCSERSADVLEDFVPVDREPHMARLRVTGGRTGHERISQQASGAGVVAQQNAERHAGQ